MTTVLWEAQATWRMADEGCCMEREGGREEETEREGEREGERKEEEEGLRRRTKKKKKKKKGGGGRGGRKKQITEMSVTLVISYLFCSRCKVIFFFKQFYLFISRQRGREGEREGEKY